MTCPTPTVIADRYRLDALIGSGGMGVVYRAHDLQDDRDVAVKLLHPDRADDGPALRYFRRECEAVGQFIHPHVVTLLAAGDTESGAPYLVMRLVPGRSFRDLLRVRDLPTVSGAISMISQLLSGLEAIHDAGFLHGDVKADNVLIDAKDHVTLIDLGLLRSRIAPREDRDEFISGTPHYMAPEIVRCEGGRVESDLYAAGTLLYELLTGTTPFAGGTASQVLLRHLAEPVVPPSARCPERAIPSEVEAAVLWALEKQPEHRPRSARAFAYRLLEASPARPTQRQRRSWPAPPAFSATTTTLCQRPSQAIRDQRTR